MASRGLRKGGPYLDEYYEKKGILAPIDTRQPIVKVTEDIFDAIPTQQTRE